MELLSNTFAFLGDALDEDFGILDVVNPVNVAQSFLGSSKKSSRPQGNLAPYKALQSQIKRKNQVAYAQQLRQLGGASQPMQYRGSPAPRYNVMDPAAIYRQVLSGVKSRNPYVVAHLKVGQGPSLNVAKSVSDTSVIGEKETASLMGTTLNRKYNTWNLG